MLSESMRKIHGKALEEAFFFKMDRELIAILGEKLQREEKIKSFAEATGIRDPQRLACLVDAGFERSTLTALIWVPLVFVAWADGENDDLEKKAILEVLTKKGISLETATMMLNHPWFLNSPPEDLWKIWEAFCESTLQRLTTESRNELIDEIIGLCYVVAEASGGFWGIGKVSQEETEVIDRVTDSLNGTNHSATVPPAN